MDYFIKIARPKEAIVTIERKERNNVTHLMKNGEGLRGSAGVKKAPQRINAKELVYSEERENLKGLKK